MESGFMTTEFWRFAFVPRTAIFFISALFNGAAQRTTSARSLLQFQLAALAHRRSSYQSYWGRGMRHTLRGLCAGLVVFFLTASGAHAQTRSKIFDWGLNSGNPTDPNVPDAVPIAWSDQWSYWNDSWHLNLYQAYQAGANKYVGLLIRGEDDAPVVNTTNYYTDSNNWGWFYSDGYIAKKVNGQETRYYDLAEASAHLTAWPWSEKNALENTANWLGTNIGRLDYVFSDIEDTSHMVGADPIWNANVRGIVQKVRANGFLNVKSAKIGNYQDFPGEIDVSELAPGRVDRRDWWPFWWASIHSDRNAFYLNSGLNVAMPSLYPYSTYKVHAAPDAFGWGWGNFNAGQPFYSPNYRSALFWAPLEKLSVAARALPAGHELIPWVNDFQPQGGYDVPVDQQPTAEDNQASIKHYRLRGADGYYQFVTTMSAGQYRVLANTAWHSLDDLFNRSGSLRPLNASSNFSTQKMSGIDWSAAQKGNRVLGVVSNLNIMSQSVNWTSTPIPYSQFVGPPASILALPPSSPSVNANTHMMVQYRTPYLEYSTFEANNTVGQTMNQLGWSGPNQDAVRWQIATPIGRGNPSTRVVMPTSDATSTNTDAWFKMAKPPGFSSTDKVSYSAMFYFNNSTLRFFPANTTGVSQSGWVDWTQQGPRISVDGWSGSWKIYFNRISISDPTLVALNATFIATHWYEVRIDVDPTAIANGQGRVYFRDATLGERDFKLLVWDDLTTPNLERQTDVQLAIAPTRNPSNIDGWFVSAYSNNVQFDNLNAGYMVPSADDNFEHYAVGSALGNQGWNGPNANQWEVRAPLNPNGNNSSLAATPMANQWGPRAWWTTKSPGFEANDFVVYSAMLYGPIVGFAPVKTTGEDPTWIINYSGPYFSMRTDGAPGFRLRGVMVNGNNYKATVLPTANHWYEAQIVIDPTRTIAGSPAGCFGVAKVYVRDATAGGSFEQLVFTNETTGDTMQLTELPLWLGSASNPTNWNGWQVYGFDSNSQIDGLKAYLYPFKDFASGTAVGAQMVGPNP